MKGSRSFRKEFFDFFRESSCSMIVDAGSRSLDHAKGTFEKKTTNFVNYIFCWHRDDQSATWLEDAFELTEGCFEVLEVLEDIENNDRIKGIVFEGCFREIFAEKSSMFYGERGDIFIEIYPRNVGASCL